MPRRPPRSVSLGHPFRVQVSLTTDLGDPVWPEGMQQVPLHAHLLDASHRSVHGYSVTLSPAHIIETGAVFHSIHVTVHADATGEGRPDVYLGLSAARPAGAQPAPPAHRLLAWLRDARVLTGDAAILGAVAGPLDLTRSPHSRAKGTPSSPLVGSPPVPVAPIDPSARAAEMTALSFDLLGTPLVLREQPEHGLGSHVWDASIVLADFLLHGDVAELWPATDFDVVELGSGLGLVSFACLARWPAASAILTDLPAVLQTATAPSLAAASAFRSRARTEVLDWSERPHQRPDWLSGDRPLLVVAADVVYNAGLLPHLAATLTRCLRARERSLGLVAYRPRAGTEHFFGMLEGVRRERCRQAEYDDVQVHRLNTIP